MINVEKFLIKIRNRLKSYKSVWNDVEDSLRKGFKDQLEKSKGPDGRSYKPLKTATLRRSRRSSKPYDTDEHETWDDFTEKGGGIVTKSKDSFSIKVDTKGAKYATKERPIGVSDDTATEIAIIVADYLVED